MEGYSARGEVQQLEAQSPGELVRDGGQVSLLLPDSVLRVVELGLGAMQGSPHCLSHIALGWPYWLKLLACGNFQERDVFRRLPVINLGSHQMQR